MLSGLLLKKSLLSLLLISVCLSSAVLCIADSTASSPDVIKLLPKNNEIKGWKIVPKTLVYGSGKTLTNIYDGGFELYTKNGVLDAAQQTYKGASVEDFTTITIHRMTSKESAKKFLDYWRIPDSKQPSFKPLKTGWNGYVYLANGAANGYLQQDRYFVTISMYPDGEKGRAAAVSFLENIAAAISKLTAPPIPPAKDRR